MRVEVLNIGTELLMGFVVNTHASYLGRKLNSIGATIVRQTCVNDSAQEIVSALKDAMGRCDLIISTGGLGPTSDDITRELVARMLGLTLKLDSKALENIETRFKRRGLAMSDAIKSQA